MKDNKTLQVLAGVSLAMLALFLFAKTRNTFAEREYIGRALHDRDTITVSGEGKVTSKPDLVRIQLGVQTDGAIVKDAQDQNTKKMNAIIAALKEMGVADKDVQTTNYSINPKIDWTDGKQRITGYSVSQNVVVKVRNLDKTGDVLAKAGELGANQAGGIEFTIDDPMSLQDEARVKAIQNAQKKAEALTDAIGLHLVKVVSFSESTPGYTPPMPMMLRAEAMDSAAGKVAPQIESGSLDVTSDVSVVFEVR